MNIFSTELFSLSSLADAMNSAFSDYCIPMRLTAESLATIFRQRSIDRFASSVACHENTIVAFWFIGRRGLSSYLIASGTLPEWRRQGLSRRVATDCFRKLAMSGVASCDLEVIKTNTSAIKLYHNLGFQNVRELMCYNFAAGESTSRTVVEEATWDEVGGILDKYQDWNPSWQTRGVGLAQIQDELRCQTVILDDQIVGASVVIVPLRTLSQIVVDPVYRRKGIGSSLLKSAISQVPTVPLKLLNVDASDVGFLGFISRMTGETTLGQLEMRRTF